MNNNVINYVFQNISNEKGNKLGEGTYGKVYNLKNTDKVIKIFKGTNSLNIENELNITTLMSKIKIGPKVYKTKQFVFNNKVYGYIIMEKMNGSLYDLLKRQNVSDSLKMDAIQNAQMLIDDLMQHGICHGDIHIHNIAYKFVNGNLDIKLIDFGKSIKNCNKSHSQYVTNKNKKMDLNKLKGKFKPNLKRKFSNNKINNRQVVPLVNINNNGYNGFATP